MLALSSPMPSEPVEPIVLFAHLGLNRSIKIISVAVVLSKLLKLLLLSFVIILCYNCKVENYYDPHIARGTRTQR